MAKKHHSVTIIPDDFTPEKYKELKRMKVTDEKIWEDLFVSKTTFQRWKRENGLQDKVGGNKYKTRHAHSDEEAKERDEIIRRAKASGVPVWRIVQDMHVSKATVYRALYKPHGNISGVKWRNIGNRLINEKPTIEEVLGKSPDSSKNMIEALEEWFDNN